MNKRRMDARTVLLGVCVGVVWLALLAVWAEHPAAVSAGSCAESASNLLQNGTMAGGPANEFGVVAAKWKGFIVGSTRPHFENALNEGWDPNGSQYIWRDFDAWDAGIYQKVTTLTPGQTYHFWMVWGQALHDMGGDNARATMINRQIGVDLSGGTDVTAPDVVWTVPYTGTSGFNRAEWNLTFQASGTTATFFLRAQNAHTDGRNKVFFDTACLYPANGTPTSTPWTPTDVPPTATFTSTPTVTSTSSPGDKLDDTDAAIQYGGNWSQSAHVKAYDGSFHYARGVKGQAVTTSWSFTGTQVRVWYIGYRNRGKAKVFVDGRKVGVLDEYATGLSFDLSKTFGPFVAGSHTLKLKNAGGKNQGALDSVIVVDALEEWPDGVGGGANASANEYKTVGQFVTQTPTREVRYIPFEKAAPGAPTPDDPSVIWDPRLAGLNVWLEPANVATGTLYWKLIRADYHDPYQHGGDFGGDHDMYYVVTDENAARVAGQKVWQTWPDDSTSAYTKGNGIADIAMWANYWPANGPGPYNGYVDGLPSDVVHGMGLPANNHVSFVLYFQRSVKAAGSETATSTATDIPSLTPSPTRTATWTATVTPSRTNTATDVPSLTPSRTPSPTATATGIPSLTPSRTPSRTATNIAPSATSTETVVPSRTATRADTVCQLGATTTVKVGAGPKGIAVDGATGRVFVGLAGAGAVAVVDANTWQVSAVWPAGDGTVNGVAFAQGELFVAKRESASVTVLDADDGSVVKTIEVGESPYGMGANGSRIWVANFDDGAVTLLDASANSAVSTTRVDDYPALVAAANGRAYVSAWGAGLNVLDGNNTRVGTANLGKGTFGVAVNATTRKVVTSNRLTGVLTRLDGTSLAVETTVTEGETPYAVGMNSNLNHAWVVLAGTNRVRARHVGNMGELGTFAVGGQGADGGDSIAVWNDYVLVGNNAEGTLSVVRDCAAAKPTRTPAPPTPTATATGIPSPMPSATPAICARKPKLLAPAANAHLTTAKARLDWSDVVCASEYGVQVAAGSAAGTLLADARLAASEFTTKKLKRGAGYVFRVQACNAAGCAGWTGWRTFYVDPK